MFELSAWGLIVTPKIGPYTEILIKKYILMSVHA